MGSPVGFSNTKCKETNSRTWLLVQMGGNNLLKFCNKLTVCPGLFGSFLALLDGLLNGFKPATTGGDELVVDVWALRSKTKSKALGLSQSKITLCAVIKQSNFCSAINARQVERHRQCHT